MDDPTLRFRDDPPHDEPAVTLDAFLAGQADATAVRLEAGDDARALVPHLDRMALVEVSFPTFRDGRGYSSARVLREAGYFGELRAAGDVLVDQLAPMRRCGFDSFAPEICHRLVHLHKTRLRQPYGLYSYYPRRNNNKQASFLQV